MQVRERAVEKVLWALGLVPPDLKLKQDSWFFDDQTKKSHTQR